MSLILFPYIWPSFNIKFALKDPCHVHTMQNKLTGDSVYVCVREGCAVVYLSSPNSATYLPLKYHNYEHAC